METIRRAHVKVRSIMESGDSDVMILVGIYLESMQLQETTRLPDVTIAGDTMHSRLEILGKTVLLTSISDLTGEGRGKRSVQKTEQS